MLVLQRSHPGRNHTLYHSYIYNLRSPSRSVLSSRGMAAYTNLSLHYIIPIAFLVDWVLTEMYHVYQWKNTLFWLSYPIFYLILTLILGSITGTYIYPFLDLNAMGTELFALVCVILAAFFLLLGALLVFLNKTIRRRK